MVNVICMKWGSMYGPEYVNHLRAGVARHLRRPHRFVCFTDDGSGLDPAVEVMPLPELGLPGGQRDLPRTRLILDLGVHTGLPSGVPSRQETRSGGNGRRGPLAAAGDGQGGESGGQGDGAGQRHEAGSHGCSSVG